MLRYGGERLRPAAYHGCRRRCLAWKVLRAWRGGAGGLRARGAWRRALTFGGWPASESACLASWSWDESCQVAAATAFDRASGCAVAALAFVELAFALASGRAFGSEVGPATEMNKQNVTKN